LLSLRGQTSSQVAHIVLRSQDTVVRVLKRFFTGGLDAVPRHSVPSRERKVTPAWEAELLHVIELDHPLVLVGFAYAFHMVALYPLLKFGIAVLITVLLCFLISSLIRKIPFANRVL
jgi:transposase